MPKSPERPVKYPMVSVTVHGSPHRTGVSEDVAHRIAEALATIAPGLLAYAPPLTVTGAMTLLGWEVEAEDGPKFGNDYLLFDRYGKKVRCSNNVRNRPLYAAQYEKLVQDVLTRSYELNGETVIIGRDGVVLNGQHTLVALVLAQQDRDRIKEMTTDEYRWAEHWPDGVVSIEKLIVYGIENTDRVVNTMDTCKPRSLADVLYRAPYFAKLPKKSANRIDRDTAAKVCDGAVRTMWQRTGMKVGNLNPRMTHSEAVRFLDTHKRLLRCVSHIVEQGDRIRDYVPSGYASAMMYLMGSAASDDEKYYAVDERTEKRLDWSCYDLAVEFWTDFGVEHGPLQSLRDAFDDLKARTPDGNGSMREKDYLVCVAWQRYVTKEPVTAAEFDLSRMYTKPDPATGIRDVRGSVTAGGVDLGSSKLHKNPDDGLDLDPETKTVVEERKSEVVSSQMVIDTPMGEVVPEVEVARQKLHLDNPECGPILMRNALKKWVLYEIDAQTFGPKAGRTPELTPSKLYSVRFTVEEAEVACDKWIELGYVVGWATDTNGIWSIDRRDSPKKGKSKKWATK